MPQLVTEILLLLGELFLIFCQTYHLKRHLDALVLIDFIQILRSSRMRLLFVFMMWHHHVENKQIVLPCLHLQPTLVDIGSSINFHLSMWQEIGYDVTKRFYLDAGIVHYQYVYHENILLICCSNLLRQSPFWAE